MVSPRNDSNSAYPSMPLSDTSFLDDLVRRHCALAPGKLAIKFQDKCITYGELGKRVDSLAHYLRQNGVQTGDFVAVLLDPSEHIVIALLAITHIGAIYAPLDPEHPNAQLQAKYQSIDAVCTITQQHYGDRFLGWAKQTLIVEHLALSPNTTITPAAAPNRNLDAPACMFFTSGTTGSGKGVLGSARAMRNAICEPAQSLHFSNADTLNSIARYAWSISMLELMAPLVCGGTTLILESKKAMELEWLKSQVELCTTFHCPPALLRNFAHHIQQQHPNNSTFTAIRLVWYGGDTFAPSHIDTLHEIFPNALIATAYGCTEIFGLSHIHFYPRKHTHKVLIGKPVPGIEQIVCDENYQPITASHIGEILLAGDRVASQYWRAPEIDSEKFVSVQNKRYFLTGDYALLHESGDLEFLQRKDTQVKIRGIRIELGEVEQLLNAHVSVQEAIVLAVDTHEKKTQLDNTNTEERELRAYLVAKNGAINIETLKDLIRQNLPDYMMPSRWLLLDALPVTENFKVNRKLLATLKEDHVEPVSLVGTAAKISEVWTEVTRRVTFSNTDNFFESGGNSLTATQLAVKLGRKFSTKIEVADVYRNPTLAAQTKLIELALAPGQKKSSTLPVNEPGSLVTRINATQGQIGLFFREMLACQGHSITCARYIFSQEPFNEQQVKQAILILLERHPTLRTNIKISRPYLELIENHYTIDNLTVIRLQAGSSLEVNADLPLIKHLHKFDVSKSPLLCAIVSPMKEGGEILQLTGHHIACDDNSLGRISKEFVAIYDSIRTNTQLILPTVSENYTEFAQQQYNAIVSGVYSERAKAAAQDLVRLLPQCQNKVLLDADKVSRASSSHFEKQLQCDLSNSVFSHFIAALSWALYHISTRTDFVFCAHSALRRDSDVSPTVGMYINLVPVVTGYDPKHSIPQHIERTLQDFNRAMSLSDIPYEVILNDNETLKKAKKFPFDAFVNELSFVEEFLPNYRNEIVQEAFATNTNEMNVTVVETLKGKFLHLESPSVNNIDEIHHRVFDYMREFLVLIE
ncbi:MAG: amino acid adenylation domain-containing protein [Lentisphaeria bacterium]|jgi:amino acid adenylation domain-containing protein